VIARRLVAAENRDRTRLAAATRGILTERGGNRAAGIYTASFGLRAPQIRRPQGMLA
jgi:hypothetical protein